MSDLMRDRRTTGAGEAIQFRASQSSYQATVTGTGAVTATVVIEVTNDEKQNWLTLGTITLSGTNVATDGFASLANWDFTRANVTALTGTGATVNVFVGL